MEAKTALQREQSRPLCEQTRHAFSITKHISTISKRNLGMPCGINEMRHALVEHFRSSTESSDARLAESLARLCKHTLRTQICIYDSWTHQEHTSQAICYLVKSALNSILEEPPTTSGATSTNNEQEVDSDDLPSPTELCALIPSDVNTGHQDTFLAKVLKYTHDGRDAQLAWLRELDTCSNYYEFQAGTDVSHEKNQLSYQHSLPSTWRVVRA